MAPQRGRRQHRHHGGGEGADPERASANSASCAAAKTARWPSSAASIHSSDLMLYPPPAGKDGFLATNSLLAFTAVLTRAYASEFGADADWDDDAAAYLEALLVEASGAVAAWEAADGARSGCGRPPLSCTALPPGSAPWTSNPNSPKRPSATCRSRTTAISPTAVIIGLPSAGRRAGVLAFITKGDQVPRGANTQAHSGRYSPKHALSSPMGRALVLWHRWWRRYGSRGGPGSRAALIQAAQACPSSDASSTTFPCPCRAAAPRRVA